MKLVIPAVLTLLLSSCATTQTSSGGPGLYTVPAGSIITLNQALTIPARKARTGVQNGSTYSGVDQWQPYCEFVVNNITDTSTSIPPGEYTVTKTRRAQIPYAGIRLDGGHQVASADLNTAWMMQANSPSYAWLYRTTLSLESTVRPDIRQVECGEVFGTGYDARHITIKEFEALSGNVMTLTLAGK